MRWSRWRFLDSDEVRRGCSDVVNEVPVEVYLLLLPWLITITITTTIAPSTLSFSSLPPSVVVAEGKARGSTRSQRRKNEWGL